ncbi:MAG TPA: hypothetical protein VM597_03155, partial [Gemmataceae bacterium]|nr:hypothetical protein [Gemmataceae bacterium]
MATTTGFKVQCPSCETMVAIKNASLVGKKIDCPKCKYRFTVEAPADVADEAGKAKAKAGAPAGAKRSRARDDDDDAPKKKKKGSSTLVVGLIVAVLALGALGVGGAYLAGAFDDESGSGGGSSGGTAGTTPPGKGSGPVSANVPGAGSTGTETPGGANTNPGGANTEPPAGGGNVPVGPQANLGPPVNRDATNLLPGDAQWVLNVDAKAVLDTPAGTTLFDAVKPTGQVVKESLGFPVHQLERVVSAGGGDGAWSFHVIKTRSPFQSSAVLGALGVERPVANIKQREYYVVKDNDLFDAVGNYFANKLRDIGFKLDPPATNPRVLTACIIDTKTIVVADEAQMKRFLEADAQPDYKSRPIGGAGGPGMPGVPGGGAPPMGPPGGPPGGPPP